MVSVTSASRYITSASRYHPRYQSRSSMYIRGFIPRNIAEFAEAVPIGNGCALLFICSSGGGGGGGGLGVGVYSDFYIYVGSGQF